MVKFIKAPKLLDELISVPINVNAEKVYVQFWGEVSAGFPSPAADFVQNTISLDESLLDKPEATYLNRVAGDSMYPDYLVGDLLVIRSDIEPRHNDDIIVSVNKTDYTLKRFDKLNNKLVALNPKYNDCVQIKEDDDVLILGVVAVLVREKCNRI